MKQLLRGKVRKKEIFEESPSGNQEEDYEEEIKHVAHTYAPE
jgi:hypothetical protein